MNTNAQQQDNVDEEQLLRLLNTKGLHWVLAQLRYEAGIKVRIALNGDKSVSLTAWSEARNLLWEIMTNPKIDKLK